VISRYKEKLWLVPLVIITVFLRLSGLGFSHFYGDETKTFYLDKTVAAPQFFLQQRKGPLQFMVVWTVEKVTNGFNEFSVRLPFAIAGILSVLVFYLYLSKKYSDNYKNVALIATYIFSLSGFFIAFSRTAQYQSFLILFGLLSLLAWEYKRPILAGISIGLAVLCHYDAVFFIIPLLLPLVSALRTNRKLFFKYVIPLVFVSGLFYLPYVAKGAFLRNTVPYIQNRVTGSGYRPNNSIYTYSMYNPNIIASLILLFAAVPLANIWMKRKVKSVQSLLPLLLWFFVPFVLFEFVFSNPGTHIYNYLIPLIILAAMGISLTISYIKIPFVQTSSIIVFGILFASLLITALQTYIPMFNTGYPWNVDLQKQKYQLFLYGFPYNRGWDQVTKYFASTKDIENFYTNDNVTIAQYYMYPTPTYVSHPKYYIYVYNNQVNGGFDNWILRDYDYSQIKDFYVSGVKTITIYLRGTRKVPSTVATPGN
jgi:4-amino-4-deoxy-L-arabinose transferase-like glycosyltransferase